MKRQRLGENTGGITQVTGTEFILFAPFITVVMLCFLLKYPMTKILQKSGIQKNEVIELIYRGFI